MNKLFEFGQYWDTGTFLLFFFIGCIIALLSKMGSRQNVLSYNFYGVIVNSQKKKRIQGRDICYILIFLIIFSVYSFRSEEVGADTPGYVLLFKNTTELKFEMNVIFPTLNLYEPLFMLITYMVRKITDNYTIYFMVFGTILAYSYTKFFKTFWTSESGHIFLIAFSSQLFYDLNVMRSALGTAFILLSICAILKGKEKKAYLLTFIGIMFHFTVIVNIPLLFLLHIVDKKEIISKKKLVFYISSGIIILLAFVPLSRMYLGSSKYQSYLGNVTTVNIWGLWNVLVTIVLSIIILFRRNYIDKKGRILAISGIYDIITLLLVVKIGMYRVVTYYEIIRLALWGTVEEKQNKHNRWILGICFFIIIIVFLLFKMSRYSSSPGFVYKTILIK